MKHQLRRKLDEETKLKLQKAASIFASHGLSLAIYNAALDKLEKREVDTIHDIDWFDSAYQSYLRLEEKFKNEN